VTYKRPKVHTTISNLIIKEERIPDLIRILKVHKSSNKEIQKTNSIYKIIRAYGWYAGIKNGNIISLNYRGQEWDVTAMSFIGISGRFVEPGGYIRMVDESIPRYWVYNFDGIRHESHNIHKRIIDYEDKKDLQNNLNDIIKAMIKLGMKKSELIKYIKLQFIKNILK